MSPKLKDSKVRDDLYGCANADKISNKLKKATSICSFMIETSYFNMVSLWLSIKLINLYSNILFYNSPFCWSTIYFSIQIFFYTTLKMKKSLMHDISVVDLSSSNFHNDIKYLQNCRRFRSSVYLVTKGAPPF